MLKKINDNNYSIDNIEFVTVLGDIHGNLKPIFNCIKKYELRNCLIVQVGDFGYSFNFNIQTKFDYIKTLKYLNTALKSKNNFLIAIRGNHDNPEYFDGSLQFSNLLLMPDYSTLEVLNQKWLFAGGAISIDRKLRIENKSWWANEGFIYDEDKLSKLEGPFNAIVTHTALKDTINYSKALRSDTVDDYAKKDMLLYQDLGKEQFALNQFFSYIRNKYGPAQNAYNGHFHFYSKEEYMRTLHITLDIDQLLEHK